ncbi:MAG: nitrite reductase [Actinomycetota bacterium]|nr:nitrite reductase [Actinomycetota bacterium]
MSARPTARSRPDRCPGVLRPWPADDGALVRIRLVGGELPSSSLAGLAAVAHRYGDGEVHLTGRANLQLRGLPFVDGRLPDAVVDAIAATGLLPSRSHERARNVMVSPASGISGGRADLRGTARELDRLLCADPGLAALPGRFLFVLDDGRGDLAERDADLGCVALDTSSVQVRVGSRGWGPTVSVTDLPATLVDLARRFLSRRGQGPAAAWHVDELTTPLLDLGAPDRSALVATPALPYGPGPAGDHVAVPEGRLDAPTVRDLTARGDLLVVTPWRGILLPAAEAA